MMARIHGLERWNYGIVDNGKPWLDGGGACWLP